MKYVSPGDPIKVGLLNAFVDNFNKTKSITASGGISVHNTGNGFHLALKTSPYRLGIIVDAGNCTNQTGTNATTGSSDYGDERYFVAWCTITNDETDNYCAAIKIESEPTDSSIYQIVTATNLGEMLLHTHSVPIGSFVLVFQGWDAGSPPALRYYFNVGVGLPQGEIQFQGYQMLSNNQTGWDFQRAHGMIS